jgi:hypothetical protein
MPELWDRIPILSVGPDRIGILSHSRNRGYTWYSGAYLPRR